MNLLQETMSFLEHCGKTQADIVWIGCREFKLELADFLRLADTEYDNGFGLQEVASDLVIVGKDWWLERCEYDGSEGWEFKQLPSEPKAKAKKPTALTTRQAEVYGPSNLVELNRKDNENV